MFNGTSRRAPGSSTGQEPRAAQQRQHQQRPDHLHRLVPDSALETIFDLEGRPRRTSRSTERWSSERGMVYSERRSSVDSDNFGTLMERMRATAFTAHPYRFPTISWPATSGLEDRRPESSSRPTTRPSTRGPGDHRRRRPAQVFALADNTSPAPASPRRRRSPPSNRAAGRAADRCERADAQSPIIAYAFHSGIGAWQQGLPDAGTAGHHLPGQSSRLNQRLVEREQAVQAVPSPAGFDPGPVVDLRDAAAGRRPRRSAARRRTRKLARDGVTADELEKARAT